MRKSLKDPCHCVCQCSLHHVFFFRLWQFCQVGVQFQGLVAFTPAMVLACMFVRACSLKQVTCVMLLRMCVGDFFHFTYMPRQEHAEKLKNSEALGDSGPVLQALSKIEDTWPALKKCSGQASLASCFRGLDQQCGNIRQFQSLIIGNRHRASTLLRWAPDLCPRVVTCPLFLHLKTIRAKLGIQ